MPELFTILCAFVAICAMALLTGAVEYITRVVRVRRRAKLVHARIRRNLEFERARAAAKAARRAGPIREEDKPCQSTPKAAASCGPRASA